jgi:uncharacterized cupredoxin-like copper-binding protein
MGGKHAGVAGASLAVLVGLTMGVAACGDDDGGSTSNGTTTTSPAEPVVAPKPDHEIQFIATDYAFAGPKTAEAGPAVVTLVNNGREGHQLGLFLMKDGVQASTVLGAFAAEENLEAGRPYGTWIAGPNAAAVGSRSSVVTELAAGRYIVACLIPSEDGQLHAMKGMLAELVVTEPEGGTPTTEAPDQELPLVTLTEYQFELPADFTGRGSVVIENQGTEVHELVIAKLKPGKTANDLIAYEQLPRPRTAESPSTDIAGTTFLDPGQTARLDLDLEPGKYLAVCYIPNREGKPHLVLGMVHPFTVE